MKLRTHNKNDDRRRLCRYFCIYSRYFQRHAFFTFNWCTQRVHSGPDVLFPHSFHLHPLPVLSFPTYAAEMWWKFDLATFILYAIFLLPFTVFIFISVSFSSQHHLLYGCIFHTRTQNTFYMLFCIRKIRCEAFVIGHKDLNIHFGIHLQYRQRHIIAACCCFTLHRNDIYRRYQPVKCFHFLG